VRVARWITCVTADQRTAPRKDVLPGAPPDGDRHIRSAGSARRAVGDADIHPFLDVVVKRLADHVVDHTAALAQDRDVEKQGFEPSMAAGADDQSCPPVAQILQYPGDRVIDDQVALRCDRDNRDGVERRVRDPVALSPTRRC